MDPAAPMSDFVALRLDHLLAQREFVRRLARSLLRDDSTADDVAQDVMVRALDMRAPARTPRGFLATLTRRQVSNLRRSESRRSEHEARSSPGSAHVATRDDDARRSLETSQLVAAEVLALDEPYRGVILRIYFEGQSAEAIAKLRGVPAATIRTQHRRALEQLRERLDRRHGGRREAWGMGLAGLLARPEPALPAVTLVATVALVLAASGIGWFAWSTRPAREPRAAALEAGLATPRAAMAAAIQLADDSVGLAEPARVAAPHSDERHELVARVIPELLEQAAAAQSVLRERLLSVPAADHARAPALPAGARGGVARILERLVYGSNKTNVLGIRGGGAYFSFTRESHSYDREPQLTLDCGQFYSGFAGADLGVVVDLGPCGPVGLEREPAVLSDEQRAGWELLTRDIAPADVGARARFFDELRARRRMIAPLRKLGHTYLVRSVSDGVYDVLAAFVVIGVDTDAVSIAWRLLREWPVRTSLPADRPEVWAPQPKIVPRAVVSMPTPELIQLVEEVATRVREQLIHVPGTEVATASGEQESGRTRLVRGWTFGWLLSEFNDGSCYSFTTRSHEYGREPDLMLAEDGALDSGFYGGAEGFIADLGRESLDAVRADPALPPPSASPLARRIWAELWSLAPLVPTVAEPRPRALCAEDVERLRNLQADRARAQLGHCYAVRSILPQEHDVLVAFEVTGLDEFGCEIRWKLLKRW
jgi:RNA polymerase sigma factor (sigma-70 family)